MERITMILQYNKVSGQIYGGYNQRDLLHAKQINNFNSDQWLTFLQAKANGLQVKKGSKGTKILSPFIKGDIKDPATGKIKSTSFIPRAFTVFNLDQTEVTKAPELIPA